MDPRGSCFGYEIRSPLTFAYLRTGAGDAPMDVVPSPDAAADDEGLLLYEWLPRADHAFHARLHRRGDRYRFWVAGVGSFVIDPARAMISVPDLPGPADPVLREERLWGVPAALCLLHRGDLPVHAAAVEVAGSAVLFGAPGRFGKSTLAAAFHLAHHRVLSEDLSCLRLSSTVSVIPGPAMLRIRQDVLRRLSCPQARVVGSDQERLSFALDDGLRGDCAPVPLRAIVLLREAAADEITLERLSAPAAIPDLWSLAFRLPSAEGRARCFAAVADLAARVPVWNLYRPLTLEGLPAVVARIAEACLAAPGAGEEVAV